MGAVFPDQSFYVGIVKPGKFYFSGGIAGFNLGHQFAGGSIESPGLGELGDKHGGLFFL